MHAKVTWAALAVSVLALPQTACSQTVGQMSVAQFEAVADTLSSAPDHKIELAPGEQMTVTGRDGKRTVIGAGKDRVRMRIEPVTDETSSPALSADRQQRIAEHRDRIAEFLREFHKEQHTNAEKTTAPPNVVVLFSDDQRAKTIHALGNEEILTPNLDQLAASGVSFPHAYIQGGTSGAVCVASRAMLLTGRNMYHLTDQGATLPETDKQLGTLLSENGYQTYAVGKWHNDVPAFMRGFQDGDEIMLGGMTDSQYEVPLNHYHKDGIYNDHCMPLDATKKFSPKACDHVYKGRHSSQIFADAAVKFLDEKRTSAPFFLYVAFTAPHDPRQSPPETAAKYDVSEIALPRNFMPEHPFDNGHMHGRDEVLLGFPRKPEEVKSEIKDYYASITYLDQQIGRIIDSLKKSGQYENTIIVFAGDNGLALGQHGLMGKQNVYEHTVGVPLIVSGPGIKAGTRSRGYCYLSDIYPTLCEMLNIQRPATAEGRSFLANLKDPSLDFREYMFFGFRQLHRAVSDRRYKLIEYNVKGERHTQLFDLQNDPWELENLAELPEMQSVKQRLRSKMAAYRNDVGDDGKFWKGVEF